MEEYMQVIDTFGHYVEKVCDSKPAVSRWMLKTGWKLQDARFRIAPDKRLQPADQYLAALMMDTMLMPLKKPDDCAIVSIFTPCELLQEVGLHPYNVEAFSCYLSATHTELGCIQQAENDGISETLCSYHKTFLGAADRGLLPKPRCIIYTNVTCDANMLTFRRLADLFQVPVFFLDVPMQQSDISVRYVEKQLHEMALFLEKVTGKKIDAERLSRRVARSKRTLENYQNYQHLRAGRNIPTDLVSPLYCAMTNNILLGTHAEEKYTRMLLQNVENAPLKTGKHIYWMHTIPYWSAATKDLLLFKDSFQIVGDELAEACEPDFDPENPYLAMAHRCVYNYLNGDISRRIEAGIRHAENAGADGVVWFNHWGCKHTLGGSQIAKRKFEAAGFPTLLLDGDGCDRSHGGEGQTSTRLGAFLEMLEAGGNRT